MNFGTVGFLAAVERKDAEAGIARALAGEIETIELPAVRVTAGGESGIGFNDVTLSRRPHDRVAELSYRIADEEVGHVRCDGLVAATPVGSTGYNLANQGPILAWGVKGYVVSYISPHSLTARALVVAPADVLTVANAPDREAVEIAARRGRVRRARARRRARGELRRVRRAPRPAAGDELLRADPRQVRSPRGLKRHDLPT